MSPPRPTLEVGYVARVHGLLGELAVRTFDPDSEALTLVRRLVLRLRSLALGGWPKSTRLPFPSSQA